MAVQHALAHWKAMAKIYELFSKIHLQPRPQKKKTETAENFNLKKLLATLGWLI